MGALTFFPPFSAIDRSLRLSPLRLEPCFYSTRILRSSRLDLLLALELRKNEPNDLVIHIVGNKADLAAGGHRRVTLEHARAQVATWLSSSSSSLEVPSAEMMMPSTSAQGKRFPSGSSTGAGEQAPPAMVSLGSFGLSRSSSRQQQSARAAAAAAEAEAERKRERALLANVSISEVSAKHDEGIEDLFLALAGSLVERKIAIESERTLRSKDSVMLDNHRADKVEDPTRVWGCC